MPGALHAELADDGRTMVLLPVGDDFSRAQITTRLAKVTPAGHVDLRTGAVTMACTWPAVVQLSASFAPSPDLAFVPHQKLAAWIRAEHARRFANPPELEKSWPDGLEPRDYQVTAARMIAHAGKLFLLDDMGLGKGIMTLLGIEQRRRMGFQVFPLLILVPSWIVGTNAWQGEIRKWMPHWPDPVLYKGPGRARLLGEQILITTYATAKLDAPDVKGPLARLCAPAVVIDEAQMINNHEAERSKAAERIAKHAHTLVECSGTLITRDTGNSFAPLKIAFPLSFPSRARYKDRYLESWADDNRERITGLNPVTEPEFRTCLLGQMLRRSKTQVLAELPPKIYTVLETEIPPDWRAAYQQMEQDMIAELPGNDVELEAMDVLLKYLRLSQLASSAADVEWEEVIDKTTGEIVKRQKVTLRPPSWKAEALMGIMAARTAPVAVFTESRQLAVITGEHYLKPAGLKFGYVIGKGQGITDQTVAKAVDDFQASRLDAIVCTGGAGGVGITLTAADTVAMLQRSPKLDDAVQPEDRAHRYGQKAAAVNVIDFVAPHTVEQRRRRLIREKGGMWAEFAQDHEFARALLGGNQ